MRRALGALLATVVLLASGCTGGSSGPSATPTPESPGERLLAEVGAVLDAEPVDTEIEHIHPPECPAAYHRVLARAVFDGVRVSVDRTRGPCPDGNHSHFACHGVPERRGHPVELLDCTTRTLDDGADLVAGRIGVYQESESLLASVARPGRTCVVGSGVDAGITTEELARVAAEIRCE
jgi:hypothetical protein